MALGPSLPAIPPEVFTPTELEELEVDIDIALREMEIEVERLEREWEPDRTHDMVRNHEKDVHAVRKRIRKIHGLLIEAEDEETSRFERFRYRAQRRLAELDGRLDALESALAYASP